jgi:hypothetical protein
MQAVTALIRTICSVSSVGRTRPRNARMKTEEEKQAALDSEANPVLSLERAIEVWYEARHHFQRETSREHLDAYNESSDSLAQAFKRDYADGAETQNAFEEFRCGLIEQV